MSADLFKGIEPHRVFNRQNERRRRSEVDAPVFYLCNINEEIDPSAGKDERPRPADRDRYLLLMHRPCQFDRVLCNTGSRGSTHAGSKDRAHPRSFTGIPQNIYELHCLSSRFFFFQLSVPHPVKRKILSCCLCDEQGHTVGASFCVNVLNDIKRIFYRGPSPPWSFFEKVASVGAFLSFDGDPGSLFVQIFAGGMLAEKSRDVAIEDDHLIRGAEHIRREQSRCCAPAADTHRFYRDLVHLRRLAE